MINFGGTDDNKALINSKNNLNGLSYLVLALYSMFIFLQVVSNSSWHFFIRLGNLVSPLSRINIVILMIMFAVSCLREWNVKQFIGTAILFAFLLAYYFKYSSNFFSIFLASILVGMSIEPMKLLRIDFYARLVAVSFIVLLSLLNILPRNGGAGVYTGFYYSVFSYGFTWSSILGYLIFIIFVEFILLFRVRHLILFVVITLYAIFQLSIGYMTGFIGGALGIILLILSHRKFHQFSRATLLLYPCLFSLTVYVSFWFNQSSENWSFWNNLISLRMPIWQYYVQNWPINLFGNSIPSQNNIISGSVIGHGALDGGYIYFLMKYGLLAILVIYALIIAAYYTKKEVGQTSNDVFWIFCILSVLSAFSETSPFLVYFSPFAFLLGSATFYREDSKNNDIKYWKETNLTHE